MVDSNVPLLLGLDFLCQELLLLNYLEKFFERKVYGRKLPLVNRFGHVFFEWRRFSRVLYTKADLKYEI